MKEMAGSSSPPCGLTCGNVIKGHSTAFNVMLLLVLISLVAFAAVLISDILSFKSNASNEVSFSVFSFLNSKEGKVAMKDRQGDAANLADQGKDSEPVSILENATANNTSREDVGKNSGTVGSTNSSLINKSTPTLQTARTAVTISKLSDSEPNKSSRKKKHSSSKNSIQANRDGVSSPSTAAENQSQLNQSHSDITLSNNLSQNLSASATKLNSTLIPANLSHPEDTDNSSVFSSNNSASTDISSQLAANSTVISDSSALDGDSAQAASSSPELNAGELGPANNGTSDLDIGDSMRPEDEPQVEPSLQAELPLQELNPVGTNDGTLPSNDISPEPQYPEQSTAEDSEWPINDLADPTSFASSLEDGSAKGDLDLAKSTGKAVPADKSSSKLSRAKDKRINNRAENKRVNNRVENKRAINRDRQDRTVKKDKTAKSLKRPTPPPRPARPKPVRPGRDSSED